MIPTQCFTQENPLRIGILPVAHIEVEKPCKFKGMVFLNRDKEKNKWFYPNDPVNYGNITVKYENWRLYPTEQKQKELWQKYWNS